MLEGHEHGALPIQNSSQMGGIFRAWGITLQSQSTTLPPDRKSHQRIIAGRVSQEMEITLNPKKQKAGIGADPRSTHGHLAVGQKYTTDKLEKTILKKMEILLKKGERKSLKK